jgi:hypothetical protein
MSFSSYNADAMSFQSSFNSIDLNKLMRNIIVAGKPTQSTFAFLMFKSMLMNNPERFSIISSIHQNNYTDPLHFSVDIQISNGWKNRIHINGYYKNSTFICVNITAQTKDYDMNRIETIATYE